MLAAPAQPRLPQIVPRSPAAAPSRLPMNPFGPAAAKPSANWDAHHAAALHRRRSLKLLGFPQRSEASQSPTIVAVALDPTESKPCSRSLICLQINQQTIAGKVPNRKAVPTGGLRPNYQRNDYIGWIDRARTVQTRKKRIAQMLDELRRGGIYMKMRHPASAPKR